MSTDSRLQQQQRQQQHEAFRMLHPLMQQWVARSGWQMLKQVQAEAIPAVMHGAADLLVTAPTAGGKTEAAFLPILSDLLNRRDAAVVPAGFGVLMLSPLKALINDQQRRLEDITRDTGIAVTPWHGDVAQSRKEAVRRHPEGVLITTPESLEAMLVLRPDFVREAFAALRYVVVDELHSFAGTERGVQLQSLLVRMRLLTGAGPRHVGLSATVADIEGAARFLRPGGERPCTCIASAERTDARIALKEYVATDRVNPQQAVSEDLFSRLRGSNNLVFTNSRKEAEAFRVSLHALSEQQHVPDEFELHHGSISRDDRTAVELALQAGGRPVSAICTASMELGVDIGDVASVAQIGTAGSPATLRQRMGRSGRRGQPAMLRIYSIDEQRDDYKYHLRTNLVQNIAVVKMMGEGRFDPAPHPDASLSIAVQQAMSLLAQSGSFRAADAYAALVASGVFPSLAPADFAELLRAMGAKDLVTQTSSGLIVAGRRGEQLVGQRDFFSAFTTPADYTIVDRATSRSIGTVQYKPYYGEIFILGGRTWIVDAVEERSSTVYVSATPSTGKMMFEGTGIETSREVVATMRSIYLSADEYAWLDPLTDAAGHLREARRWFARRRLDTQHRIVQGGREVLFTWGGMRLNRTLALMASALLGVNPPYDHLAVTGLSAANIATLARLAAGYGAPSDPSSASALTARLVPEVPRVKKERGKFDTWLPDSLLDRQYAATRLDIPGALAWLAAPEPQE